MKDGVALMKQCSRNTKLSGKVWFAGFMKRLHKLNLRQPELTSVARVSGFNEVVVHMISDVYVNIVDENKLQIQGFSKWTKHLTQSSSAL
jgi:hypothetical protein